MTAADIIMAAAALVIGAAFACRVDRLFWARHPVLMAVHSAGGIGTAWVLKEAATGGLCGWDAAILAGAAALLVATYRHLPHPGCK